MTFGGTVPELLATAKAGPGDAVECGLRTETGGGEREKTGRLAVVSKDSQSESEAPKGRSSFSAREVKQEESGEDSDE